jgi:hypothetical protein
MFQPTTVSDLITTLKEVQRTASNVYAWTDNDGEPTLNAFANSGVGGERSDALLDVIAGAERAASESLQFTQEGEGKLHQRDRKQLEKAGFRVLANEPYYTAVEIPPSKEACRAAEEAGEDEPEAMELVLISQPDEED